MGSLEKSRPAQAGLSRAASRLADIIDGLDKATAYLAALGLAAMTAIVFLEVVMRFFFTRSTLVADELAAYLFAAMCFFGLGYTLRTEGHIRVNLIFQRLPAQARRWLDALFVVVGLVALSFFLKWLLELVVHSYVTGADSQSQLGTALWIPQSALVYGTAVLVLALVSRLIRLLTNELRP